MQGTLTLIHTSASLAPVFRALFTELAPDISVSNVVDESLLTGAVAAGGCTPSIAWRLACLAKSAQEAGASAVMVTCSSMGTAVEAARPFMDIAVLRVDQPMAEKAVSMGTRIGIAATLPTTMEPTRNLIESLAERLGKTIDTATVVCEGAFQAYVAGDQDQHDRLVESALVSMSKDVDVIVLAQASMARVAEKTAARMGTVPVLSSPRLAVEWAAGVVRHP